jgi:hypothetical protein
MFERVMFERAMFERAMFERAMFERAMFERAMFERAMFEPGDVRARRCSIWGRLRPASEAAAHSSSRPILITADPHNQGDDLPPSARSNVSHSLHSRCPPVPERRPRSGIARASWHASLS